MFCYGKSFAQRIKNTEHKISKKENKTWHQMYETGVETCGMIQLNWGRCTS